MWDEFDDQGKNNVEKAWELFEKTGNVSYYLIYKNLIEKK